MKSSVILLLFFFSSSFSQDFDRNSIYFVSRGTLSKKEIIGERFNLFNKEITHVGIGLVTNDTLYIYNVSTDKTLNNSSLIIEKISDFKNINDIFYFGVWEYKSNEKTIKKIKKRIKKINKQQISFDKKFDIRSDDELYCSEFVFKIIKNVEKLNFKPSIKELNKIEKEFLGVNELIFIPVDFFLSNQNIINVINEYIN